ncbi:metal ABC transporter substrate-binding protein [Patescibacteria group bacterium]|nr:metal ABC transporter substrate-binding protein [Patescibacteria group bacterium]
MKKIFVFLLIFLVGFAGCWGQQGEEDNRVKVISSIYPIGDIVSNIGGKWIDSQVLLEPGVSPHNYSPTPGDIQKLSESKAVFVVGAGMDDWVGEMAEGAGISGDKVVDLSQSVELIQPEGGSTDPHYWTSPKRVLQLIDDVKEVLVSIDSAHKGDYEKNYEEFKLELENINVEIEDRVSKFESKDIVVFHDAFGYFATDYGLNIVGVIEPVAGTEPTPRELEEVVNKIRDLNIKAVFKEPQLSDKLVEAIKNYLQIEVGTLDPLGGIQGRMTYLSMVKFNLLELARFLE